MNAKWHEANPMPKHATVEQRMVLHQAHQKKLWLPSDPAKLIARMASSGVRTRTRLR